MKELKNSSKVKRTQSTTVHESKVEPFQIVQVTTTNEETQEVTTKYLIGVGGQIASKKEFQTLKSAELYIARKPWELIINLNFIIIKMIKEYEESKKS